MNENFENRKKAFLIRKSRIILLAAAVLAAGGLSVLLMQKTAGRSPASSVPGSETVYTGENFLMDTFVSQRVYAENGEEIVHAAADLIEEMENICSAYLPESELSRVNAVAGASAEEVSEELFSVLDRSLMLSGASGGVFDITIAPLVRLWGITSETPRVPAADEIHAALKKVDFEQVILDSDRRTVFLPHSETALDLGGVVKGLAAEKCRELYRESGASGALISLGGTVAAVGTHPDGTPFQIGLRDPRGGANDIFGKLVGEERIIAASGGYERYFEQDGVRYEHILDPRTGYPAQTDLLSVTAISDDGLLADYLSTTLYLLGSDVVRENLNRAEFSVIAIKDDGTILISDDLKERFIIKEDASYVLAS